MSLMPITMSYREFLAWLEKTPRDWQIMRDHSASRVYRLIRRNENDPPHGHICYCPLEAVWKMVGSPMDPDPSTMMAIIDAADSNPGHNPDIRRDLLRACGLVEEPA